MSILKHASSPNWYYSFQIKGKKHFGSTGTSNKTVAKKVEDGERRKAIEASLNDKAELITLKAGIQLFLDSKRNDSEYGNIKARANKLMGLKNHPGTKDAVSKFRRVHRRLDHARRDGVDPDAARGVLDQ